MRPMWRLLSAAFWISAAACRFWEHNILFDYSFIKQAAINARLDFEKEAWDTLKIARKALPDLESRSLEALCGYYQIPREHAHRAMDDVLETLALFRKLEEGFSEDHPEWFAAAPLKAKMKREVPATEAQKKYLADLIRYHELDLEPEWEHSQKAVHPA